MRNILVKLNVFVNKTQGVFDWGLNWKKLGLSRDPVYYIPILGISLIYRNWLVI